MGSERTVTGAHRPRIPAGQEKVVVSRSGNRCAYPSCGKRLVFEAIDPIDQDKAIGKVAHICAASAGGPRYEVNMTDTERGSASNLIYLCADHHDAVDSQTSHHSRSFLESAKHDHEVRSDRAMAYSIGELGFAQLEAICKYMVSVVDADTPVEPPAVPLDVTAKRERNSLSARVGLQLAIGLAASSEVARYIDFSNQTRPDFGLRVRAFFKARYFDGVVQSLTSDDLFDFVLAHAIDHAGPDLDDSTRAAALAVVCHMFEICEVFESVDTASR